MSAAPIAAGSTTLKQLNNSSYSKGGKIGNAQTHHNRVVFKHHRHRCCI